MTTKKLHLAELPSTSDRYGRIERAKALVKTATRVIEPLGHDGQLWEATMSLLNAYSALVHAGQEKD